mmetsp:Transcript_18352/g.42324  ORF Transcript_18352/g.42324 Transcript_18352/m.42324 type:complete len:247 (+) Transcript_18352:3605-4345(+)
MLGVLAIFGCRRKTVQFFHQHRVGPELHRFDQAAEFVGVGIAGVASIPKCGPEIADLHRVGVGLDQDVVGVEIGVADLQAVELRQDPKGIGGDLPQRKPLERGLVGIGVDVPRTRFEAGRASQGRVPLQKLHDQGPAGFGFPQELDEGGFGRPRQLPGTVVGGSRRGGGRDQLRNRLLVLRRSVRGELPGEGLDGDVPALPWNPPCHPPGAPAELRPRIVVEDRIVEDGQRKMVAVVVPPAALRRR